MLFFILACTGSAFLVSLLVTGAVRKLAPRWGLIDQPGHRKVHVQPTPMGGGIGIWCGVMLPVVRGQLLVWWLAGLEELPGWIPAEVGPHLAGVKFRSGQLWGLLGAATILGATGLVDDFRNLPWKPRLAIQLFTALLLVFGVKVQASVFVPQPWVGQLLTVGWILVLVNALNFLDNMDGLTGGIALIASVLFAVVMLFFTAEPRLLVAGLLLVLAGSVAGFLWHNWTPAKIFMGDGGSYFIGTLLACITVLGTFYDESSSGQHVMLAPLFILAVPLYDFCSVMYIRLSSGRSPFHGDKNHFSHRLVDLGLRKPNAVLTVHLATLATGLGALLLYSVGSWGEAMLVAGLVACLLAIIAILETASRRKNNGKRKS